MHLVLDHSALIPCGDKPEEEKRAIRMLGDALPRLNVTWHVSKYYLKTLQSVGIREWRKHHPLPKLQSALARTLPELIKLANTKRRLCKPERFSENTPMRIHVVARRAYRELRSDLKGLLDSLGSRYSLSSEDVEVLAIALKAARNPITLVTTDTRLLEAASILSQDIGRVRPIKPSQLVQEIDLSGS